MNQEKIGKFIQNLRIKNNLTQKEFADILGVTPQAVSKWETGKNIPDISVLAIISKEFNIDIDEIINGSYNEKTKSKRIQNFIIILGIFLISILLIIIILNNKNNKNTNLELKEIKTMCTDFEITGTAAYNNQTSTMYISKIKYCGKKDEEIYQKIECNLYENNRNVITKVNKCKDGKNTDLESYLNNLTISVENYIHSCNKFQSKNFYIEIVAITNSGKTKTYKVPLTIENTCE